MIKLILAIAIILAGVSPSLAGGVMMMGGGIQATGETCPASGASLGGSTTSDATWDGYWDWQLWSNSGYTATWAESCASTTASKVRCYVAAGPGAGTCAAYLYSGTTLIATGGSTDVSGWSTLAVRNFADFGSAATITKGNTYKIAFHCSSATSLSMGVLNAGHGSDLYYNNGASYPASPLSGSAATDGLFRCEMIK